MNDQSSCLCTLRVKSYAYRGYLWGHIHGFNSLILLHGVHCVIMHRRPSDASHAKDDVPHAPFAAKLNDLVHDLAKHLFDALPKG